MDPTQVNEDECSTRLNMVGQHSRIYASMQPYPVVSDERLSLIDHTMNDLRHG